MIEMSLKTCFKPFLVSLHYSLVMISPRIKKLVIDNYYDLSFPGTTVL